MKANKDVGLGRSIMPTLEICAVFMVLLVQNAACMRGPKAPEIVAAIRKGDRLKVEIALRNGADPNTRIEDDTTAVMVAAENDQPEIARLLVEFGADVNAKNRFGNTALIKAARWGSIGTVELLESLGADVNAKSHEGFTALMAAADQSKTDVIELLIERGADVNSLEIDGGTVLARSVFRNDVACVRLLIGAGVNVNARRSDIGQTPLITAAAWGHLEVVQLLRAAGADTMTQDSKGYRALDYAKRYPEIEKLLSKK